MPPPPMVEVRHLRYSHPDLTPLFVDWSATIPAGVSLLQGDSGSGKTTLLRLLAGELQGDGDITLHGRRHADDPAAWHSAVCWLDPHEEAFAELTPAALMAAQRTRHPALDAPTCERHLAGFGLAPHLAKPLYALSAGSRRKVGLAIALGAGCALTLLDEPAAGLDAASLAYLAQALAEHAGAPHRVILLVDSHGLDAVPFAATIALPSRQAGR